MFDIESVGLSMRFNATSEMKRCSVESIDLVD